MGDDLMYPLKFEFIPIKKIWAGKKLNNIKNVDKGIGITWDFSAHKTADCKIKNGKFKGKTLTELIKNNSDDILGKNINQKDLIRVAYLDADEHLSIQVHPDNNYALKNENDNGKTETWYIVDADEGAYLYAGTSLKKKSEVIKAIEDNNLENFLNRIYVKKGDVVSIPAGTIHALGKGILAIEVGQNSNITYRLYDFGRGRDLDIKKSLDVIDIKSQGVIVKNIDIKRENYVIRKTCEEVYTMNIIDVQKYYNGNEENKFKVYTCVNGEFNLKYNKDCETIKNGESIFIAANFKNYLFEGLGTLIESYVTTNY
jgi:mannose-6-phosphate isomerase